jgi:ATP-dependent Clp protease ATP-binding subunit ClpA
MHEKFTDRANKVMELANEEANRNGHEYLGTEAILLGLLVEGAGVAANVLKDLNVDTQRVRVEVEKIFPGAPASDGARPLPETPRAMKVIEYALDEARCLSHNYVGTEHLLLGLIREEGCVAAEILVQLGLSLKVIRREVLALLGHFPESEDECRTRGNDPLHTASVEADHLPMPMRAVVEEFDRQIAVTQQAAEKADAAQDWEKAAASTELNAMLIKQRAEFIRQWPKGS